MTPFTHRLRLCASLPRATIKMMRPLLGTQKRQLVALVGQRMFRHCHGRWEVLSVFSTVEPKSPKVGVGARGGGLGGGWGWGWGLLKVCSNEAEGRHTHRSGCRMDAQWSAIVRHVKMRSILSIRAMPLPPLHHHCASFGAPIACIGLSLWRPLCLHSATTAKLEPTMAMGLPQLWATCCASPTVLMVRWRHKGRAVAFTQKQESWV